MVLPVLAVVGGLGLLVWSANRFVDGSASMATLFGIPPLLVGMLIVGMGTSAPEVVVGALSAYQNVPGLALGTAYGSNIVNIALILGVTALITPIAFQSRILRYELPILTVVSCVALWQCAGSCITRGDGAILLGLFVLIMIWMVRHSVKNKQGDSFLEKMEEDTQDRTLSLGWSFFWVIVGLVLLIVSSRFLVWGAVEIAHYFRVSDLVIGLTIVAVGTSLPELASSMIAARKGQHDLALGNVLGSNMFNTLVVVGIAALIKPIDVEPGVLVRDLPVIILLTLLLFIIGYGFRGRPGRINRFEGAFLLLVYLAYNSYLARSFWG